MSFDPLLADIRFGCGASPKVASPAFVDEMLSRLKGPDTIAAEIPIEDYDDFEQRLALVQAQLQIRRKNRGNAIGNATRKEVKLLRKAARVAYHDWFWQAMQRRVHTRDGLRERLVFFWADHFTAQGKQGVLKRGTSPYIEQAIRPHVNGRFADMLRAVAIQPLMLHYLDQKLSMGPGSDKAARRGAKAGLNENLAREMLELHTLGVGGPYDQEDVRQLAELLTGLTFKPGVGFAFRKDFAEPGAEEVLGRSYGGGEPRLRDIMGALDNLAAHPATAQHIAEKLAVHFVRDVPDPALVAHIAARFRESDGDLVETVAAMLEHPAAWGTTSANVKQPVEFVGSAMRALAVPQAAITLGDERRIRAQFLGPLTLMGQKWEAPLGPDGWPEEDVEWITPQRMAARLDWAMTAPEALIDELPDPRALMELTLGARAPSGLRFAAQGAETKAVGLGLVFASPSFQRM